MGVLLCIILIYLLKHYTIIDLESGVGTPNNISYRPTYYVFDKKTRKYIGKSTRGIDVYAIKGDTDNNFLCEWGDNIDCYVKGGYEIPQSGTVTAIFSRYKKITENQNEIDAFIKIMSNESEEYTFSTDNLAHDAREFYFAYDNCLVAKNLVGYLAYIDDKWMFIKGQDVINFNKSIDTSLLGAFKGVGNIITDEAIIELLKSGNMLDIRPASYE